MHEDHPLSPDAAAGRRVALVVSRYHAVVTARLRDGAAACFRDAGGREDDLIVAEAPGAFELVPVAAALARRADVDGVACLGCILSGETTHDRYLAAAVAQTLADLAARHEKPVAFGVLTCQTPEQAAARAGGDRGDKGRECMQAVLETIQAVAAVRLEGLSS